MADADGTDLVESSYIRPLVRLLAAMDRDIAAVYDDVGLVGFRPRFSGPLIQLGRRGALTVRQLADAAEVTHSAMSQTVAAMRRAGLVEDAAGEDARTRRVKLAPRTRSMVEFLEAEWRATEQVLLDLEAEVPYPLAQVVGDLEQALSERSFGARIRERLDRHLPRDAKPGS